MKVRFYTPHILLQEFVQCIMVVHAKVNDEAPTMVSYPPTPQQSLFFYINDPISVQKDDRSPFTLQPRSVLVGLQTKRVVLDVNRDHKAVRVGFHPGGMYRLLGLHMHESIDESFDASDIFGNEIRRMNTRLCEAVSFDEISSVIESWLLTKVNALKRKLPFDAAMHELLRTGGTLSMEHAASLACLSTRQFERTSKERLGMSPKLFARLVRFSKAYRLRENFSGMSWTNIAHECGYFDQAHFIRDFKEFAGVPPGIIEKELQRTPLRMQASMRL